MSIDEDSARLHAIRAAVENDFRVREDNLTVLEIVMSNVNLAAVAEAALQARSDALVVEAVAETEDYEVVIEARDGGWSVREEVSVNPRIVFADPNQLRYNSGELAKLLPVASVTVSAQKRVWQAEPWLGWSIESFTVWCVNTATLSVAEDLFRFGPLRIGLLDWQSEPWLLGSANIGPPNLEPPAVTPESWPVSVPRWLLLAAQLRPSNQLSNELRGRLNYIANAAQVSLLSRDWRDETDGTTITTLDNVQASEHRISATGNLEQLGEGLVLFEWVSQQPDRLRLTIARRILADSIETPGSVEKDELLAKANLAYRVATDERAIAALAAQTTFEDHVVKLQEDLNQTTRDLGNTVDEIVTRVLTAILAIFGAAVISKDVRGWPILVAVGVLVAYIAWTIVTQLNSIGQDIRLQSELVLVTLEGRPNEIVEPAKNAAKKCYDNAHQRVDIAVRTLLFLIVILIAAGSMLFISVSDAGINTIQPTASPTPPVV